MLFFPSRLGILLVSEEENIISVASAYESANHDYIVGCACRKIVRLGLVQRTLKCVAVFVQRKGGSVAPVGVAQRNHGDVSWRRFQGVRLDCCPRVCRCTSIWSRGTAFCLLSYKVLCVSSSFFWAPSAGIARHILVFNLNLCAADSTLVYCVFWCDLTLGDGF